MSTLQERVEEAIAAGYKPVELARAAGTTTSAVSQWRSGETRQLKAASALGLQVLTSWAAQWWVDGTGPRSSGVAQPMGHYAVTLPPLNIAWEALMQQQLPQEFETALADDAMAPFAIAGTLVKFRAADTASPGDAVLVSAKDGAVYFREYRVTRPGVWQAWACNPAYPSLDGEADGLCVIAVFVGIETSWARLTQRR